MFALKGAILSFFGSLLLFGSSGPAALPGVSYIPVDSIVASDEQERIPLFFDAVLDISHASTHETPAAKVFPFKGKSVQSVSVPLFYELSYYSIGQQIVVNLTTKDIIFPFHCFT